MKMILAAALMLGSSGLAYLIMRRLGIVTCGLVALVYGWMNADRYNIKNLMIAWTVAVVINIGLSSYISVSAPRTTVTYPGGTTVTR